MRAYLESLLAAGRVRIIEREVSGRFELAAVTARSQQESDDALLFRKVAGSAHPVITNLFGSRRRLIDLLPGEVPGFCQRWTALMAAPVPAPAPVIAEEPDLQTLKLSDLPAITYFETDAGPYITAGVFLARDPASGVPNLSFHRGQIISDREIRIRLGDSHHLTRYQEAAERKGEALEAAILIGPPPEIVLAAAAPVPFTHSEIEVAAKIARTPPAMRRCRTVALDVPAETEIVIEGRILPRVRRPEGPFGEFMGYYVPQGDNHVFEVTAVTARRGAHYHALVCGSPEDMRLLELAVATRVYESLLAANVRGLIDVACVPMIMSTVVQIEQQYEGHARQVLLTAMGANHDWSKSVFVVDEDVDIGDFNDVWWAYLTRGRADQRALIVPDVPGFYRDPHKDHWGRIGIDATCPFGRKAEFARKRIPGAAELRLVDYLRR
ncbi:MAG TPA: UbiD family decarboxylase [Alphaproteobacteria bacterium]|nr:UbiD family decarboxylase [Alphaproteobacteria bacterium]